MPHWNARSGRRRQINMVDADDMVEITDSCRLIPSPAVIGVDNAQEGLEHRRATP